MKRHSITEIVMKAQTLTLRNFRYTMQENNALELNSRFSRMIAKAATKEIIRLEAETELAAERATPKLFNQFDKIDNEK